MNQIPSYVVLPAEVVDRYLAAADERISVSRDLAENLSAIKKELI